MTLYVPIDCTVLCEQTVPVSAESGIYIIHSFLFTILLNLFKYQSTRQSDIKIELLYQVLKEKLEQLWKVKFKVVPAIIGAFGAVNLKSGSSRFQPQH